MGNKLDLDLQRPERGADCASSLTFDRYLANELETGDRERLEAHVAGCSACAARLGRLKEQAEAFLSAYPAPSLAQVASEPEAPPSTIASSPSAAERAPSLAVAPSGPSEAVPTARSRTLGRRARSRRFEWVGGLALAAAAVLLAVFFWPGAKPTPLDEPGPRTRIKGKPFIGFHIKRGEGSVPGRDGQTLHPGDNIRFVYHSLRPAHLALIGVDRARQVSVYVPYGGARSLPIVAAKERGLPGSIVLDETLGTERYFGVFCPEPFELAPLRAALARSAASGRPELGHSVLPRGCTVSSFAIHKVAR